MEYKNIRLDKINESGVFYGYASIFNVKDSYGDIVLPNAFRESILFKKVKMFFQHNPKLEIGKFLEVKEDQIGLFVKGFVSLSENYKIYSMIKNNLINGLSIGYKTDKCSFDKKGNRILEKINLLEISLVQFPANKFSHITYCV